MRIISVAKRTVNAILRSEQLLAEIREDVANLRRPVSSAAVAPSINILPIQDIEYPHIPLVSTESIMGLMNDASFAGCVEFFSQSPSAARSLVSPNFQALIFSLVKNVQPRHVFEIGTYQAATSEAICRALHSNGAGLLHTIDPYGADTVPHIINSWPPELARYAHFYSLDSMLFFERMKRLSITPDIVFIDGNHDYEYALFDINAAANVITPGGLVLVDNISQPGPFLAAREFLRGNPSWSNEALISEKDVDPPYDLNRTTIPNTDCAILKRPLTRAIHERPETAGQQTWRTPYVTGVNVPIKAPASGSLGVQCILRSFGDSLSERASSATTELRGACGNEVVLFEESPVVPHAPRYTVETWLTWRGEAPLQLAGNPSAFANKNA
jgi:predicted O-methyltransferase YrrM